MADVVVVGAGLGGLATAARLAKLGHRVTVCERGNAPGGLLRQVRAGGLTWDATPFQTTIPAVLRDLFRKSGRPLERYVDLELSTPARRHVFADGTTLDLPTGSRAGQLDAVSEALGEPAGTAWTRLVDGQADAWARLRSEVLDPVDGAVRLGERRVRRALRLDRPLARYLARELGRDVRLRQLAGCPVERCGDRTDDQPALRAVEPYVERTFGVWRPAGGAGALAAALITRMEERSVDLRYGAEVVSIQTDGDRITGVALAGGSTVAADVVVTAVHPHRVVEQLLQHPLATETAKLFTPASAVPAGTVIYLSVGDSPAGASGSGGTAEAAALPVRMLPGDPSAPSPAEVVGHDDPLGALPAEVVFHGDPLVTLTTDGGRVDGAAEVGSERQRRAWTVTTWGATGPDPLATMAERGLDLRHLVTWSEMVRLQPPSPAWAGPRVAARRAALAHPLPGLFLLGTALVLGPTVPYVAWQAASVAELVGKA